MEDFIAVLAVVFVLSLLISGCICGKKTDKWLEENSAYFGKVMVYIWTFCVYLFVFGLIAVIVYLDTPENLITGLIAMAISVALGAFIFISIKKKNPSKGVLKTLIIMLGVFWGDSWNRSMRLLSRFIERC